MSRLLAAEQLLHYKSSHKKAETITSSAGNPVDSKSACLTAGPRGPILLQDVHLLDELAHFDRERIPERVVHAKGAGAFGYFEVTHDVTEYTKLSVFSTIGKRTPVAVRFSTVSAESGSSDTVRDPRGFAVRFYSEDGNWDVVGNNVPIFFVREPMVFPGFVHTLKRNPTTHLKDVNMFWDFNSMRPETTHHALLHFSDRGIPDGYRHMNGYGSHTFKLVNSNGDVNYCKFHYKTNQGIKNLPVERAAQLAASDPDYSIRDLYNTIAKGDYPSWTWYLQIMTPQQAEEYKWNPFDVTKVWPHGDCPLIPVGQMVLDRNPTNYFAEVEQIGFNPANMIPGVEPSTDRLLQARLFAYGDTQRHRLGANYLHLPVNCPYRARVVNHQRDGPMCYGNNQGGSPNYFPNSFSMAKPDQSAAISQFSINADVTRHEDTGDEDEFSQPIQFYKHVLGDEERQRLIHNIADSLKDAADFIQERTITLFTNVDSEFAEKIRGAMEEMAAAA